jgi:hypothetical protein
MANPSVTAVTPRLAQTSATAIQQSVASGLNFTGALPLNGAVRADSPAMSYNSIYAYAQITAAAGGGLFFWNTLEPLVCSQIHIDLGGSGDITVYLVNLDPAQINSDTPAILSGQQPITIESATAVNYLALDESHFKTVILPYQAIQIVTTASSAAQVAQVVASIERTYLR